MKFVDRQWELGVLDEMWSTPEARFLVLYGRRRVGKTRLLTHWLGQRSLRAIYWVAKPDTSANLLRSFSQALYREAHPGTEPDPGFTYPTWEMAWKEVADLAHGERLALFIDEFTYTLDATPDLAGTLQNAWDHSLSHTNLFLVLAGSHLGMMERELLAYRAPLYGRANARLLLRPLPFSALRELFPSYDAATRVALYATLGGIPAYLERFDPDRTLSHNVKNRLLTPRMDKEILLGEVEWSRDPVGRRVVTDLVEKASRVVPKGRWTVHYSFFARAGFTEPARSAANEVGGLFVDLNRPDEDLSDQG